MKNSNDTIGNRTRDFQTCRAVPQPTAPPRAHNRTARLDVIYSTNTNVLHIRLLAVVKLSLPLTTQAVYTSSLTLQGLKDLVQERHPKETDEDPSRTENQ